MTETYVLNLGQNALMTALILAGPFLLASLVIGSLVSLFQAATQISETTLNFVPKILGVGLIFAILGSWMGQQLLSFTRDLLTSLPELIY
ncbi:MAG: flagellar biosynthesis protein FliQ [Anaerolineales bacterium]|nr:flagellar biosynthesis protein FliQ [Anaerolineales bacterium]